MREIKFRGRENDERYGFRWVYGDLTHSFGSVLVAGRIVEEFTVGQFTGLKDWAGQEIYEGDIVTFGRGTEPSAVRWDNEFAYFVIMKSLLLGHACKAVRVIGNVHDNPDLLEVAHD